MSDTVSIGDHWMHERFAKNLLNASHARELNEAAAEWRLARTCTVDVFLHCHFCNTAVNHFAVLMNDVNKNEMIIGYVCYEKFREFLMTNRIQSVLPEHGAFDRDLHDHWKKIIAQYGGKETFLGWFAQELASGNLPEDIGAIMRLVQRFQSAPTYDEADRIVEYYKDTRKLPAKMLLGDLLLNSSHRSLIPKFLTINEAHRLRKRLQQRHQSASARRIQQIRITDFHEEWGRNRANILSIIEKLRTHRQWGALGPEKQAATASFEALVNKISEILPEYIPTHATRENKNELHDTVIENIAHWENYWGFSEQRHEVVVIVRNHGCSSLKDEYPEDTYWIYYKYGVMWQTFVVSPKKMRYLNCDPLPYGPSLCRVYVCMRGEYVVENIVVHADLGRRERAFPTVTFDLFEKKHYGKKYPGYIGSGPKGVVIIPNKTLSSAGTYQIFITARARREWSAIILS